MEETEIIKIDEFKPIEVVEAPPAQEEEEFTASPEINTYELNKIFYGQGKPLSAFKTRELIGNMACRFRKWVWDDKHKYFMLLCKERSDYTLFNMIDANFDMAELKDALWDCFINRGEVYDIHFEKNTNAYEVWLKIDEGFYVYYLFPYDIGVIEIGAENG